MDKLGGGEIKTSQGNEVCASATANNKLIFSIAPPARDDFLPTPPEIHRLYVAIPEFR
nr:unnamed protein product [Callosobruchus chinensis]